MDHDLIGRATWSLGVEPAISLESRLFGYVPVFEEPVEVFGWGYCHEVFVLNDSDIGDALEMIDHRDDVWFIASRYIQTGGGHLVDGVGDVSLNDIEWKFAESLIDEDKSLEAVVDFAKVVIVPNKNSSRALWRGFEYRMGRANGFFMKPDEGACHGAGLRLGNNFSSRSS